MNAHDSIEATKLLQCVGRQSSVASSKMVSSLCFLGISGGLVALVSSVPFFGISRALVSSVPFFGISKTSGSSAGAEGWTFAGPFWLPFSSTMLGRGGDTCWPEQSWSWPCSPCAAPSPACDMTTSRVPKCMNKTLRLIFLDGRFSWLILCYKRWMLLVLLVRNIAWPTCSRPNCAAANHSWLDLLCSLLTAGNSTLIGILIVYHLFGSFCILFWSVNRKWSLSPSFWKYEGRLFSCDVKVFLLSRFRGDLVVFWASAWQVLRLNNTLCLFWHFTLQETKDDKGLTNNGIAKAYLRSSRSKKGFFVSCTSCTSCFVNKWNK